MASSVRSLCSLLCIALLFFCAAQFARAQNAARPDDPFAQAAVMHTGFINPDCVPDTVYGFLDNDLRWTPRFICWGYLFDREGEPICETTGRDSSAREAASRRRASHDTTHILLPDWIRISCAFSVQRYNANDSLDDLIFWLHGADSVGRELVDTARSLVLFGQRGLEKVNRVDLASIGAFRSEPFYAMELTRGRELINPKKRDMTRRTSRELVRVDRQVLEEEGEERDTGSVPAPQITSAVAGEASYSARIYPNPAVYSTTVEVSPLPAGTYRVEVVAVNGEDVWRGEAVLEREGQVLSTLDLGDLAGGYYVVRVHTDQKIIGTYPIIVVR